MIIHPGATVSVDANDLKDVLGYFGQFPVTKGSTTLDAAKRLWAALDQQTKEAQI